MIINENKLKSKMFTWPEGDLEVSQVKQLHRRAKQ